MRKLVSGEGRGKKNLDWKAGDGQREINGKENEMVS